MKALPAPRTLVDFLIDFFSQEKIENTNLFPLLNCSKHEASLLREMACYFFGGEAELEVTSFLRTVYQARGLEIVPYLKEIGRLIKLGWVSTASEVESVLELRAANVSLSRAFLHLLETGGLLNSTIKTRSYTSALEYLRDEWARLDLIMQCNKTPALRRNHALANECKSYLAKLEATIDENLNLSKRKFKILQCFKKHHLNKQEKLIILLLAQAQYNGAYTPTIKEIAALGDSYEEKVALQNLLAPRSKLIRLGLVGFLESFSDLSFMDQELAIPDPLFNYLVFDKSGPKVNLEEEVRGGDLFDYIEPKRGLESLVLDSALKARFEILLQHLDPAVHKRLKLWGLKEYGGIDSKILLYGDSGTGKTSSAYALAKDLGQKILSLDCSRVLSMYVGESEKNVRRIFDEYKDLTEGLRQRPLLLLDEADQLLGSRGDSSSSASRMYHQMQNIFLRQIEEFKGILVATTNLVDSLDSAFSRRFHYKLCFSRPNEAQRRDIWALHLPKKAEFSEDTKRLCERLASFELSGGQIKIVVENTAYKVATREKPVFSYEDFYEEIQREQGGDFGSRKKAGFLA